MNQRNLIIVGVAAALGLLAVYLANVWFSGVEEQQDTFVAEQELVTIAVASQEMEFGTPLNNDNVRMASWPADSVPQGAILDDAGLARGRVAIRPIAMGEPILQSRISGRASLSANLPLDMRAVSIPVNEVTGVAGFVLPGDVVDVLLTSDDITTTLLENVLVLAIDRRSNEQNNEPAVVETATLQVDPIAAQQLTLARQIGNLTLALRNVENQQMGPMPRTSRADLGRRPVATGRDAPVRVAAPPRQALPQSNSSSSPSTRRTGPEMVIVRGTTPTSYEVQRNGSR
ncbi:Flp pilus assembly protein CpaB [Aurantiacibacter gilvus]|uniref:Flp pilus assembly protein CpaB n=1 Tax=Aurantiacibacter gilvus TaxID=3139141 RepID=A0ABU9IFL4_9SPHN